MPRLPRTMVQPIDPSRLTTFSDAVLAVIITVMVLQIVPPRTATFSALRPLIPIMLAYILSFTFIGIYWNNHHHLLRATERINGLIMWANLHLLFWLSLIPAITKWVGEHPRDSWPAALYGIIAALAGLAYFTLSRAIIRANRETGIQQALGSDVKGIASEVFYAMGAAAAFIDPWVSYGLYVLVSFMWLIPDRRLTRGRKHKRHKVSP